MRNPPDNNSYSSPDARRPKAKPGGRRARTIRDMFALEEPLRRLTSAPAFRRRANGAAPRSRRNNPPDLYDLEEQADASSPQRPRWTEPGIWVREQQDEQQREQQREPDRTDTRRPNRGPAPRPSAAAPQRAGASGDLRWRQPDWLGQAPKPGDMPPIEPAPPTTPRYSPTYGPGDSETPRYQSSDYDSGKLKTDYRATSVRSALWASRTPGYQPDQPPAMPEPAASSEHPYFNTYDASNQPASLAHAGASMSADHARAYTPGAVSEVERLRQHDQGRVRTGGPAPYFWEMVKKPRPASPIGLLAFWLISALLIFSALGTAAYAGVSLYAASQLVYAPQILPKGTPADAGLAYKIVSFPSRTDHLELRGWFIPGVAGHGKLSTQETIIVVHGIRANRTDPGMGLLDLSDALAKNGFAVLAFDMRGSGESSSAPTSLGYYEQRDVLGAVDFLKSGAMPYPDLGRPKAIGGWGVSMGAATLLLAAAQEPSIQAVVSDSAYADVLPILEREIPARAHLPHVFTPGILQAANVMYGIDFSAVRPEAVVARIAPRPILFIHGAADTYVPPDNMTILAQAAQQAPNAHVQTWSVPNATHAQAFKVAGAAYVSRVVAFFKASLSTSGS
ncbi:MAG TPA: alpha/beta hydrolase [Ktedonobacterales bacterium]|jgi:fermentation-respiration switch protein FrsA (DUF1100 family)